MSVNVTLNGSPFILPTTGEVGWGSNTTSYLVAIAAGVLQKTGGSFTLSADTDFGASFGLKSLYYLTRAIIPATAGQFRLGNTDIVAWRNGANSGNMFLSVNASDQLTYDGIPIAGASTYTANRAITSNGTGGLTAATTTATEIGYVNGVTSAIQTQINTKAPSASPTFTGTVTLPVAASRALATGASSDIVASATTATELGYVSGVTSAIQTQINTKLASAGGTMTGTLIMGSSLGITFTDAGSDTVNIAAPANITASYTLKWPSAQGAVNQYMANDGSGNLSWTNAGSGTVNTGTAGQFAYYATSTDTVSGQSLITTDGTSVILASGTVTNPILAFAGDLSTGFYKTGGGVVRYSAVGVNTVSFINTGLEVIGSITNSDGSAGSPSYTFSSDNGTGMYRFGANNVGIAAGGANILRVNAGGLEMSTGAIFTTVGSAASPSFAFVADPDTGVFQNGADNLGLATGGALRFHITSTGATLATGLNFTMSGSAAILNASGSLAAPAYSFSAATATGAYYIGSNAFDLVSNGTSILRIQASGLQLNAGIFRNGSGSAAAPTYTFDGDEDTGLYRTSANSIGITQGGVLQWDINASGAIRGQAATNVIQAGNGTVSVPSFSFASDEDTGMYRISANRLGFATGGGLVFDLTSSAINSVPAHGFADGAVGAPGITFTSALTTGIFKTGATSMRFTSGGVNICSVAGGNLEINSGAIVNLDGSAGAPTYTFTSDPDTGMYRAASNNVVLAIGGVIGVDVFAAGVGLYAAGNPIGVATATAFRPGADNTVSCGAASFKWTEVFATNGTINTSHSSTKSNIRDLEDLALPRGVRFERDGREYIGYLNDNLPTEARPQNDATSNYESAVVGILCAKVRKLEQMIEILLGRQ